MLNINKQCVFVDHNTASQGKKSVPKYCQKKVKTNFKCAYLLLWFEGLDFDIIWKFYWHKIVPNVTEDFVYLSNLFFILQINWCIKIWDIFNFSFHNKVILRRIQIWAQRNHLEKKPNHSLHGGIVTFTKLCIKKIYSHCNTSVTTVISQILWNDVNYDVLWSDKSCPLNRFI